MASVLLITPFFFALCCSPLPKVDSLQLVVPLLPSICRMLSAPDSCLGSLSFLESVDVAMSHPHGETSSYRIQNLKLLALKLGVFDCDCILSIYLEIGSAGN